MRNISRLFILALGLIAPVTLGAQSATLFRNVSVFDGTRQIPATDVLVTGTTILRVGKNIAAPAGATVVDGAGKTLLPGLIDSHTHTWGDASRTALMFGITTELDMFTAIDAARAAQAEQRAGKASGRADLLSAGTLVTAPGGHGTEYGMTIPTITSADSAQAFVDARIAEGSEWIKIVYDNGKTYGMTLPTLGEPTLKAVIAAAHKRNKLAVVHVGDLASARTAIAAGADGLVHLFVDQPPDAGFGALAAGKKAFVIPTLTVLMSITGTGGGAPLATDSRFTAYLSDADRATLVQGFPRRPGTPAVSYANAEATVRQLKSQGVSILAGTDAGNPGTSHGAALHRELELLVQAGLTPVEALAAATSVPARAFRLADRGRIAQGARADLLLVEGDPTTDITATRSIAGVWKEGVRADRAAYAKEVADARSAALKEPSGMAEGLVSDFEDATISAKFGAGWSVSNDAMAGGKSAAQFTLVDGGANGSGKALGITGTISDAVPYAWAGAMFSPGQQMFAPVNLSSRKELRFWARGDGKTYRIMMFAQSKGTTPLSQNFVAGPEWKEYVFPFSAFQGIDGQGIMALIFVGGPQAGSFSFRIDDVRFR